MRRIGLNDCPYCGGVNVYRSQPKTWLDRACGLFLLRLARCHECMHSYYRPLFLATLEYPRQSPKKATQTIPKDEKRKRSA
jgi:predicted RNA-binding Zn-ribbon protein involved in translation (DUF1610 family)